MLQKTFMVGSRWRAALVGAALLVGACGATGDGGEGNAPGPFGPEVESTSAPGGITYIRGARTALGAAGKPLVETAHGIVVADEVLVRLQPGAGFDDARDAALAAGGDVSYVSESGGFAIVRFVDGDAADRGRAALAAHPAVLETGHNHVCAGTGIGTSPSVRKDLAALQWNLPAMGLDPLGARASGANVTIAVLDTGVAYEDYADAQGTYKRAPDLADVRFAPGWDFVNGDAHPNDDQRHGTHVTNTIAATRDTAGIEYGATIMPVKVLDASNAGTEAALADGLRWATDHGAQVINLSLSFPPTYFPSRTLQGAVDYAAAHGVVMVAAAGNHGEALVSYPAAFRDVIAVGASSIPSWYQTSRQPARWWDGILRVLERAPYSDHGYKLDVLAPAGVIAGDANGDGRPEAVLAQTFAPGDPTAFGWYYYAGTSQAAAEVSGIVAAMLSKNPQLGVRDVRAMLDDSARQQGIFVLSPDTGRGMVQANQAIAAAGQGGVAQAAQARSRTFANVSVTLHDQAPLGQGTGTIARAHVEVIDASGAPVPFARVYGLWTGAAFGPAVGYTDWRGRTSFDSVPLAGTMVVAFQVDAVLPGWIGSQGMDRPRGFLRIDSASLGLLAAFGAGIGTSPSGPVDPGAAGGGSGIGTSPSGPADPGAAANAGTPASPGAAGAGGPGGDANGAGIGTSPGPAPSVMTGPAPITVAYDPALFAGTGYRATLLLPNFSWGLATSPMAVAVDEAWFLSTFPDAASRRVLSSGSGIGTSPLRFDTSSFPVALTTTVDVAVRIPLIVQTFTNGIGTSPGPRGTGIGTSPGPQPGPTASGIGTSPSIWVDWDVGGLSPNTALKMDGVIGAWYASAAGIGTSPSYVPGAFGMDQPTFNQLSLVTNAYLGFAPLDVAAPAASYVDTLSAAGMPMAPLSPAVDGAGIGVLQCVP